MSLYLLIFYALLRMFFSRRLSLLGIFALISSWPVSQVLVNLPGTLVTNSYFLLWTWTILWAIKSSTCKSGIFVALTGLWGVVISRPLIGLYIIQLAILFYFFRDKTAWFKKEFFKYTLIGLLAMILILVFDSKDWNNFLIPVIGPVDFSNEFSFFRKAFFILSFLGPCVILSKLNSLTAKITAPFKINMNIMTQLFVCMISYYTFCFFFDPAMMQNFSFLWVVAFFGLLPVELIFQSMMRFRSMRNIIYLVYILFCLLDSHLEVRMKHFVQIFRGL